MMITLEQITCFDAVYRMASYSAAGRDIGKSRSNVREHISALEDSLNTKLFEVNGKKVVPTDVADRLKVRASNLIKHAKDFEVAAINLTNASLHELIVCYDSLFPADFIAELQQSISSQFPSLTLKFHLMGRAEAYSRLKNKTVHIALLASEELVATSSEHEFTNLGYLPLKVYVGEGSKLDKSIDSSVEDLRLETQWILSGEERDIGYRPISNRCQSVGSVEVLLALLSKSGWALLPENIVNRYAKSHSLTHLPVKELSNDTMQSLCVFYPIGASNIAELNTAIKACEALSKEYFV